MSVFWPLTHTAPLSCNWYWPGKELWLCCHRQHYLLFREYICLLSRFCMHRPPPHNSPQCPRPARASLACPFHRSNCYVRAFYLPPTSHWKWADFIRFTSICTECSAWKRAALWLYRSLMHLGSWQWNVSLHCLFVLLKERLQPQ